MEAWGARVEYSPGCTISSRTISLGIGQILDPFLLYLYDRYADFNTCCLRNNLYYPLR